MNVNEQIKTRILGQIASFTGIVMTIVTSQLLFLGLTLVGVVAILSSIDWDE